MAILASWISFITLKITEVLYVDRGIGRCLYETMNNSIAKVKAWFLTLGSGRESRSWDQLQMGTKMKRIRKIS